MLINRSTGSVLLICGTCIGAGMLALPVVSAPSGFLPAVALLSICWLVMYVSGLLVLEVNLWLPEESSFISMAQHTLGKGGQVVAWVSYLLLLYSLIAAYLAGGGDLFNDAMQLLFSVELPSWVGPIPWVIVVGGIIYLGTQRVDLLNRTLMIGLLAVFLALMLFLTPHIQLARLSRVYPSQSLYALPVVITAFGYHVVLPSVRYYLHSHTKKLVRVVFWGSFMPFVVYLVWEMDVLGIIPMSGEYGLRAILKTGHPAVDLPHSMALLFHNSWIVLSTECFVFFALASSFLGIALSLFDFFADGFHLQKTPRSRVGLVLLTLLPPYAYASFYPQGFILALSYAGVFVAILNILLPALMVWAGRWRKIAGGYQTPGGLFTLISLLFFSLLVIFAEFWPNPTVS